jgi:hypothetical protein
MRPFNVDEYRKKAPPVPHIIAKTKIDRLEVFL